MTKEQEIIRKRVTLHPLKTDGSTDISVNLYPKTFLDGIVDREGNPVEVAQKTDLDAVSDTVSTLAAKEALDASNLEAEIAAVPRGDVTEEELERILDNYLEFYEVVQEDIESIDPNTGVFVFTQEFTQKLISMKCMLKLSSSLIYPEQNLVVSYLKPAYYVEEPVEEGVLRIYEYSSVFGHIANHADIYLFVYDEELERCKTNLQWCRTIAIPQTLSVNQSNTINLNSGDYPMGDAIPFATINGQSIVDNNSDIVINTFKAFNPSWTITGTTKVFCDAVNADTTTTVGNAYLGGVRFSDLPFFGNGDVVVQILEGPNNTKSIHLILTSGDVAPYHWEYTYWNNGSNISGWKGYQTELKVNETLAGTEAQLGELTVNGIKYKIVTSSDISSAVDTAIYGAINANYGYEVK